jgi:hypothetical protein
MGRGPAMATVRCQVLMPRAKLAWWRLWLVMGAGRPIACEADMIPLAYGLAWRPGDSTLRGASNRMAARWKLSNLCVT